MFYFNYRKMHLIILFTLFPGITPVLVIQENVVFHKSNEIALTRPKWLSTFIINLKPYKNFLNKLPEDLRKAKLTVHSIEQFYDFSKQDHRGIMKELKGEIVALLNDQHILVENNTELHAIHTKMKRSLIRIIGKGLGYLLGTATEFDLKTIDSSISRLPKCQDQIAQGVGEKYLSNQYNYSRNVRE